MVNARLRGFYATALTRLLLDEGFEIVQLSPEAQRRFGLDENSEQYDVTVHDRPDLQGVEARGSVKALEELRSALWRHLLDAVMRSHPATWQRSSGPPSGAMGSMDVEFPSLSKSRLDELRSRVVPTLSRHHFYRAAGGEFASAVAMAEKLLEAGRSREEVESLLKETVERLYPVEADRVGVQHVKLNGTVLELGLGVIESYDEAESTLRLRRSLRPGGLLDGLGLAKQTGDYAVTELKLGAWSLRTKYYSKGGCLKGSYLNVNTPVELYPAAVRYVDLELDVVVTPDGQVEVLDLERLEGAAESGVVSPRLVEAAKRELKRLLASLGLR